MNDKLLKVIVALAAVDKMSSVIRQATNNSISDLDKLKKASQDAFGNGSKLLGAGVAIGASLAPAITAFADLEDSSTRLKTLMMDSNGSVGGEFEKINKLAISLGNKLPGTTADFQSLFSVMLKNGLDANNVLNGVGQAAAYLSVNLKMPADQVGELAARMKLMTGVADSEMLPMLDQLNRIDQIGIKADDMPVAFQKSAGTLQLLGVQGLEASKQMANLYAQLIRATGSPERVGTGFKNILQAMLDPKKYAAMQDAAKDLGITLNMFDNGKFMGVENMVKQLDKLKGLKPAQIAGVAKALTGGGGDEELMLILAQNGVTGFQKMNAELNKHASLQKQVGAQLQTLRQIWEATTGTITNLLAAFGAGLGPELKRVVDLMGKVSGAVQTFLTVNPAFAKFIGLTVAGIAALLSVFGVINLIKGAFIALRVVMLANPFMIVAMVAIAGIALIYSNWGRISGWFKSLWNGVKQIFSQVVKWLGVILGNFTPVGLIYTHWNEITTFFSGLFDKVKDIFFSLVSWVLGLGPRFFNAGTNIVKSIWNGIKSMAHKPIEAIADITKKMRDYLPFSPAKAGAFRDLHKIKLVETIAASIKPMPLVNAMSKVTSSAGQMIGINGGSVPKPVFIGSNRSGNTITVNFNPTINGGGNPQSVMDEMRKFMPQFIREFERAQESKSRTRF